MLGISNEKAEMIGCPLAGALRWQRAEVGAGRPGVNVSGKTCSL